LSGSKYTRLLKHGLDGHTVAMVAVSWTAKPCGVSSRVMMLRAPPDRGVWLVAGPATRADSSRAEARTTTTRTERDDRRMRGLLVGRLSVAESRRPPSASPTASGGRGS